ncbi:MAG: adenylate/guanylate cyclase domain-containing protein [Parasphingorhabdus sp.]|uniref:adenylate/guanylate cyclase domain-containing protein n=1 Tax=Parasphingorhabdus sp. TaxID=2709688 RepID=UPI00329A3A98
MGQNVDQTKSAIDKGNLLLAYDLARVAIDNGDDSEELRHLLVLTLARMGDGSQAMALYHEYGLDRSSNAHHRSIAARILKDAALALPEGNNRHMALTSAYRAYADIYEASGDAYPAINAASLALLSGQKSQAQELASAIIDRSEIAHPKSYYDAATLAEALLINERVDEAAAALFMASQMADANSGAKSSTIRQLALLAKILRLDESRENDMLAPISPPTVIHFAGHMFLEDAEVEAQLRSEINGFLDQNNADFAYGSLAAGSDILIAEAIIARGGELHVTLPFVKDDFIAQSVLPAGQGWIARFEKCLAAAKSVHFATEMNYVGDAAQFGYASKVAMGMAKLRSEYLGTPPQQLAIWDELPVDGPAGTGADVKVWADFGGATTVIKAGVINRDLAWPVQPDTDNLERGLAAYLFTDFPGFSKLAEANLPAFWKGVMGRMASVLEQYPDQILAKNSWGDAVLAITLDAPVAADIALALQESLEDFDYELLGLSEGTGMRIGVHYGPAYQTQDLITGKTTFYGTEVSRAARIEPVTPPGAVFVTEPFAAILVLEAPDQFKCRYVGNVEFAKGYGTYPIYRLTAV